MHCCFCSDCNPRGRSNRASILHTADICIDFNRGCNCHSGRMFLSLFPSEALRLKVWLLVSPRPSVMGPMKSSPPSNRHAAGLTLLSVVDAKAATSCYQRER
jgi:hypothetical protein